MNSKQHTRKKCSKYGIGLLVAMWRNGKNDDREIITRVKEINKSQPNQFCWLFYILMCVFFFSLFCWFRLFSPLCLWLHFSNWIEQQWKRRISKGQTTHSKRAQSKCAFTATVRLEITTHVNDILGELHTYPCIRRAHRCVRVWVRLVFSTVFE